MLDFSKVTGWTLCCLLCWLPIAICYCIWTGVLYYHGFFDDSSKEEGNTLFVLKIIGIYRLVFAMMLVQTHGFGFSQLRLIKNPRDMCPALLCKHYIKMWTKERFSLALQICNFFLIVTLVGECQILNVLYYEKWSMFFNNKAKYISVLVFGSHIGVMVSCLYVILFRFYKGLDYFYNLYFWDDMNAMLDGESKHNNNNNSRPLTPRTANKLESIWKNNNNNQTSSKHNNCKNKSVSPTMKVPLSISYELQLTQYIAGNNHESPQDVKLTINKSPSPPSLQEYKQFDLIEKNETLCHWIGIWIARIIGFLIAVLILIIAGLLMIIIMIFIYFRIYIFGKLLCMDYLFNLNKSLKIELKRVSDIVSYLLFIVLFEYIKFDVLLKFFVEHEPTKWCFTHAAMVFFHGRYIQMVKSCIPDYNLIHDYTTYDVLYDNGKTTYTRLLPRCSDKYISQLPPVDDVVKLFVRENDNKFIPEKKMNLSLLFAFYVRWFTHQFANTNEFRHNYSRQPIGVNLSQLYGSTKGGEDNVRSYKNGLLQSIVIDGKEFPPIIGDQAFNFHDGRKNSRGFETQESSYLQLTQVNDKIFQSPWNKTPAVHGPDFFCIQLIFWRHHQYIARQLKLAYPSFDDEKIFQICKMCNILTCIRITLGLYGYMGIVQSSVSAEFDYYDLENLYNNFIYKSIGQTTKLFPSNSKNVHIELNFMYRWHQLIPPKITINKYKKGSQLENVHVFLNSNNSESTPNSDDNQEQERKEEKKQEDDKKRDHDDWEDGEELRLPYKNYVDILTRKNGLESFLMSSLNTRAGKLCLFNTEKFLCQTAVRGSIKKSRFYGLESFNNYRARLGFEKYKSFEELTDDKHLQSKLKNVYGDIDNVEFYVGMFAEEKVGNALHGPFLTGTFAPIIISLITSSKLLRKDWNTILTPVGKQIINKYTQMDDLISLHTDMDKNDIDWKVIE